MDLRGHEGSALVLAVAEPGLEVVGEGSQVADLQIPRTVSVDGDVRTGQQFLDQRSLTISHFRIQAEGFESGPSGQNSPPNLSTGP